MFEKLINRQQLSSLSDDALFLKLIEFEESNPLSTVSAKSLDLLFQEAIDRKSNNVLGCVLDISEHRRDAFITQWLVKLADLNFSGGNAVDIMYQLYTRSLDYEGDDHIYTKFIRRHYELEDLFAQPARTFAAKTLLLLGKSDHVDELLEIFQSENDNDYVELNIASVIYLSTGQEQYLEYVQHGACDEDQDFSDYANICLEDISEHLA